MSARGSLRTRYAGPAVGALWVLIYLGARALLEAGTVSGWLRVAVAVSPVAPAAAMLALIVGGIRRQDELHRRVHLEALAIAFPLAILLLMTLGLLELVLVLPAEDLGYRHVWAFLPMLYFGALGLAWRRYR